MARSLHDVNAAIMRARDMPYGAAHNEVAAALVREVLADGPREAQAFALFSLAEAYAFSEEIEKAYLPFTQSVRLWDEHPELFDAQDVHSFFWSFKWMVGNLMEFPAIPATQIEDTLADMRRRYQLAGNGLSAVNHLVFQWHHQCGRPEVAESYEAWITTERDDFSQCPACEPGDRTSYLFENGHYEEGIRLLEAAEEASDRCHSEPADRLAQLQLAYLEVGNLDGAAQAHRKSLQHLIPDLVGAHGAHIQFLARTGNTDDALRFLTRNQKMLVKTESPAGRLAFLTKTLVGTTLIRASAPETPLQLESVPARTVAELDDWIYDEALGLAGQFDTRAGTQRMTSLVRAARSRPVGVQPINLAILPSAVFAGAPSVDPVPSASTSPATPQTGAGSGVAGVSPDAMVELAEAASHRDDLVEAARLYAAAGAAFERSGALEAAGFAFAEAAVLSDRMTDSGSAQTAFAKALDLLAAAGTGVEFTGPVVRSYARVTSTLDDFDAAVAALARTLEATDHEYVAAREVEDSVLAVEPDGPPSPQARAAAQHLTNIAVERGRLLDTRARVLATSGQLTDAADDAKQAAEALAEHGLISDASHAFWLAGRLQRSLDDHGDALWLLESASEGFQIVRDTISRSEVVGELSAVLTSLGRTEEAEAVVRELAG